MMTGYLVKMSRVVSIGIGILVIGLLAIILSSCDGTTLISTQDNLGKQGRIIFVLFDLSGSTIQERQDYLSDFKIITASLDEGDVLVADKIVADPLSSSSLPINISLPRYEPVSKEAKNNDLYRQKEYENFKRGLEKTKKQVQADALSRANTLVMNESSPWTDVLSAMYLAERVFSTYQHKEKVLVIFSDMVQDTKDHRFEKETFTPAKIEEIIKSESDSRGLPKLEGARVYVVGACSSDSEQFMAIRGFWEKYFKACGAALSEENYGKRLLSFK